jgi:hypothetical protein
MANNRLDNGSLYFEGTLATTNLASLRAPGQLGQFFNKDGKKYQLVRLDTSAVTAVAGQAVVWIDFDDFVVTNDISDAIGINVPAGVLLGVVTAGNYGYIQVRGVHPAVLTDGGDDIAANDTVIVDPSVDGVVDSVAAATASTHVPLGIATAADVDADNTVAVFLTCPLNG